jgi:hypothetical protein
MTTNTTYRRFIPPSGRAAEYSIVALLMLEHLRNKDKEKVPQKAELDHWEDEGGSVAATDVAEPRQRRVADRAMG